MITALGFPPPFACFFCGVDSKVLLYFVIAFVACTLLATIFFLLWAVSKGDFSNIEQTKYDILEDAEDIEPPASASPAASNTKNPKT